ncbi:spermidine/putrescine ABC transporter substrate-binding protein [Rathayibacter sp. YIM 133350]|uniref:spermidine/putrescine ABC transporter substrate-binding protein n=1 Tax=Rathayibacter sp. YIM 133350 TaxID=3131992 RepID=UPI00307FC31D
MSHEVDNWLRWLPRWRPGTHRSRTRLCRRCFGSPIVAAAGLATDVPHAVQHALTMRMKLIIDAAVDDYTDRNLPLLRREIELSEQRKAQRPYRPADGLAPEATGLELDPEPEPDAPYLFTLGELASQTAAESAPLPPEPLTEREKEAIRAEVKLADEYARQIGKRVCTELSHHRARIERAVSDIVEPQIAQLLADLDRELDSPLWPGF